jgi:hypothetical protein
MQRKDLEKQLKVYYLHESSRSKISKEKLRGWYKRGEEFLIQMSSSEALPIGTNLFKLLLKKVGTRATSAGKKRVLRATGLESNELERLEMIEKNVNQSYLPSDESLIFKLIMFFKIPISKIRKHVDDKMMRASEALMMTPTSSIYMARGVDDREPELGVIHYQNVLSQYFWDKIAERIAKEDQYNLLD